MRTKRSLLLLMSVFLFVPLLNPTSAQEEKKQSTPQEMAGVAIHKLIEMQKADGHWPYYISMIRDDQEEDHQQVGVKVAATAIAAQALLFAAPDDKRAQMAVQRGLAFVLKQVNNPRMEAGGSGIDLRIWGQTFALEFLCHIRAHKKEDKYVKQVEASIPHLVKALIQEQSLEIVPSGGWTYVPNSKLSFSFVTAPVTQALLLARSQGEKIPETVFERARCALEAARTKDGAFMYYGISERPINASPGGLTLPGSVSRSVLCETTLVLLGSGSIHAVQSALDNFYKHWDDMLKCLHQSPHQEPYGISSYYFHFGHRYAAQAIQMLPEKDRISQRERLWRLIFKTRQDDGTWNDFDFTWDVARKSDGTSYGTSVAVLVLLGDKVPLPPKFTKK